MANQIFRIKHGLDVADGAVVVAADTGDMTVDSSLQVNDTLTAGAKLTVSAGGADINGPLIAKNSLQVDGDFIVHGTTTTVNSAVVTVDDPIFTLGGDSDPTASDGKDRGIEFRYYDGSAKRGFMGYSDNDGKFRFLTGATNDAEVFSGTNSILVGALEGNADTATAFATEGTLSLVGQDISAVSDTSVDGNYSLTISITDNAITFAKMQDIEGMTVLGRTDAGTGQISTVSILDEDDMATNSATALVTQQSVKAYIGQSLPGAAEVRGYLSATGLATYNPTTGVIGWSGDTDDIDEGLTNLYYTDTRVRTNRLDQLAVPTVSMSFNSQKVTNLADGVNSSDAINKGQLDSHNHNLIYSPVGHTHTIDELSDVDTATSPPIDGQSLTWSNTDSAWRPGSVGAALFSSATAPSNPSVGSRWYNTDSNTLYTRVSDGQSEVWIDISTGGDADVISSATAPSNPKPGDHWYNINNNTFYVRIVDGAGTENWIDVSTGGDAGIVSSATAPLNPQPGNHWYDTDDNTFYIRVLDGAGTGVWLDISTAGANVLGDLVDVDIATTAPTDGQVIIWDDAGSVWKPGNRLQTEDGLGDVTGPSSAVDDRLVTFNGTTGKLIQDSGTLVSDFATTTHTHSTHVEGPSSAIDDRLVAFNSTTGKLIKDSGHTATSLIAGLATTGHTHGIDNLTDVDTGTVSPTDGQALVWDDTNSFWEPGTIDTSEWTQTGTALHPKDSSGAQDVVIGGTTTANADIALKADGSAVFNEQGVDVDFRIESSADESSLFVEGSDGNVGVGTNTPLGQFSVGTIERNLPIHTVNLTNGRQTHPTTGTTTTCNEETYIMHNIVPANAMAATLSIGGGWWNTAQSPGSFKTIEVEPGDAIIFEIDVFAVNTGDPLTTGAWKLSGFAVRTLVYSDTGASITGTAGETSFTVAATGHNLTDANVVAIDWSDSTWLNSVGDGEFQVVSTTTNSFTCSTNYSNIANIAQTNPCLVTTESYDHGFDSSDVIKISGIEGMTELNGNTYTITKINDTSFTLNGTDATGFTAYTSGGVAATVLPNNGPVTEDWFADGVLMFPATVTKDILSKNSYSNGNPKLEIDVSSVQFAGTYGNFYITLTKVDDQGDYLINGDGSETKVCCIARVVRMSS